MKIKKMTAFMVSLVAIGFFPSGGSASGLTADQLSQAGFDCFQAGPNLWTHCLNFRQFGKPAVRVLVFAKDEDGGMLLGTEQLIRQDIYEKGLQPCPQNGLDMWDFDGSIGYYACHHFDTG